jgi:BNR repeat protein
MAPRFPRAGMEGRALVLLLTLPALAGCLQPGEPVALASAPGDLGLDAALRFIAHATGADGVEPTIGATSSGALFVVALTKVLRSRDAGSTWQDVTPPVEPPATFDPFLYVDPATDRVLVSQLTIACVLTSWSDDEGETWVSNPLACGVPVDDHQKLAAGDNPLPAAPYPSALYMAEHEAWAAFGVNQAKAIVVSRSLDGGLTWQGRVAVASVGDTFRTLGPLVADRNGTVAFPLYSLESAEDGGVAVEVSRDHGDSWARVDVAGDATARRGIDPGMSVDPQGNLFLVWEGRDGHVHGAASRDHGATWSAFAVSPPGLGSTLFPTVVPGEGGRLNVAYYGTRTTNALPEDAPADTRWHLYVSATDNAFAAQPMWRTAQATQDPVQVGPMCGRGVRCADESTRNHADFLGAALLPDGRVAISYVDGCAGDCREGPGSRQSKVAVAVQEVVSPAGSMGNQPSATAAKATSERPPRVSAHAM